MPTDRPKRIAVITGGRDYHPTPGDLAELGRVLEDRDIEVVRTGGARGVDTVVNAHVRDTWERESWPADWDAHGKSAGPKRNAAMLSTPGVRLVVAFKGNSGTLDCIRQAKRRGIDVHVIGEGRW